MYYMDHTDIPGRFPAKETSHLPINDSDNLVVANYNVRRGEVVMHEAHIWVVIRVREKNIVFQGINSAIPENSRILDSVKASLKFAIRLDSMQQSKQFSSLLFE
jgi:hypothetical protein